jgi:hypothetical protein
VLLFISLSIVAQEKEKFVFSDEGHIVKLVFENNAGYLELNKPIEMKVYVENIDLKMSAIMGPGIRPLNKSGKNFFTYSVTVNEKSVVNSSYQIIFTYRISEDGETKRHKFFIPVAAH